MNLASSEPTRRRILVANRGEIATRLLNAAREHDPPLTAFALAWHGDAAHTLCLPSQQVIHLPESAGFVDIDLMLTLVKKHHIDLVHPGYGFLSESADFARRMWDEAGTTVIGPGWHILDQTGDKLAARSLAEKCGVPVLPAMAEPTDRLSDAKGFVDAVGLPVMIKAVDGGGGRGIRLVKEASELKGSFQRAVQESPSRHVFVEKAAVDGFRHIEVQVVGDGTGNVIHLWERECSIQRRYQKIIELAPSSARGVDDGEKLVASIIEAAVGMAQRVKYLSLGTFEFLANTQTQDFFFLEVNPRLQVEHTVTEQISGVDIVDLQLKIAQGTHLADMDEELIQTMLRNPVSKSAVAPRRPYSVQLRLTAEDPERSFSLSIGKITAFTLPNGAGIRVDTNLVSDHEYSVTADFDSLLAKIIVTGTSWGDTTRRARRALEDTRVEGVKTNLDLLRAIVASSDFTEGQCDTQWLEKNIDRLSEDGRAASERLAKRPFTRARLASTASTNLSGMSSSTVLLRKGDAWNVHLKPMVEDNASPDNEERHLLKLNRVLRNEFPSQLAAEVEYTTTKTRRPLKYRLNASVASGSSVIADTSSRRGNTSEPSHIIAPFSGTLVEVLADIDDYILPGQVVCVIKQMKMELEVKAQEQQRGRVRWITETEDGGQISEGTLIVELDRHSEVSASARL